jgi:uncharacterized protein YfaS (alpha-2-macroglobulin family)
MMQYLTKARNTDRQNLNLNKILTMPVKQFFLKLFLPMMLLCFCSNVFAQDYQRITIRIDSFANIGLPKSALAEVSKMDQLARLHKNTPMQIKAAIYRMTFQSYLEENSLVAIIDTLRSDIKRSVFPVKPVLQSILANMYFQYYQQNRWQFSQRTRLASPGDDFMVWDLQTIFNEISRQYNLSLQDEKLLQNTPVDVLNGVLAGNRNNRYLRPTLYDLLLHRALDFFLADEPAINKPKQPFSINDPQFFGESQTFAHLNVKTTDTSSTWFKGIRLLQQGTLFHLQNNNEEALADLSIRRVEFLHNKSTVNNKDSLYLTALQRITTDVKNKPICADAIYLEGKYYQQKDSLRTAIQLYKNVIKAFPESVGGINAFVAIRQIEAGSLSATVENVYSPGKPLLAQVTYQNLTAARVYIYKLSSSQNIKVNDYERDYYNTILYKSEVVNFFEKLNPVQQMELKLPDPMDYRLHHTEFKIDSLANGNYAILIRGITNDTALMHYGSFKVSHIAYANRANPDGHLQFTFTDRETGKPLPGVNIYISGNRRQKPNGSRYPGNENVSENGTTDATGSFITRFVESGSFAIELRSKGDTLIQPNKYAYGQKSIDDDEERDRTIVFTDRQIYRPGQTIYFKVLEIFAKNGKNAIRPYKADSIELINVNNKSIGKVKFTTNEYGTFGGSFIIPQNMLNGTVTLRADDGQMAVSVEEYKRPTFQVEFLPVKESYKPNDSVSIKGKVTAFSGYGLSQAKVAYHITRTRQIKDYRIFSPNYNNGGDFEIAADTITTDDQGNYTIKFKAVTDDNINNNYIYNYHLNADVTDAGGETHAANNDIKVGNPDIEISTSLPDVILAKDSLKRTIVINNLNGQQVSGSIRVEVFALQHTSQFFKTRFWPVPDQYLLSRDDYKRNFPEYAYRNEDGFAYRAVTGKVEEFNLKVNADTTAMMQFNSLPKQAAGVYKIKISALTARGDTVSLTRYISLVADGGIPQSLNNWAMPVKLDTHKEVSFLVGADRDSEVLMEKYNGDKIVISKWLYLDKGQQYVKIPLTKTDRDVSVQFLMIHQNRLYTRRDVVNVDDQNNALNFNFLSFHNKLQPGEKEKWKLRISGGNNEKVNAELLASLYDASLDNLTEAQNWTNVLGVPRFPSDYFTWSNDFQGPNPTRAIRQISVYYNFVTREYERLNMFNYNYYGGYNSAYREYMATAKQRLTVAESDQALEKTYNAVSAQVKKGVEITGEVTDNQGIALPGVVVRIKDTRLMVSTNSKGYFRIKVPVNASLVFSFIGYKTQETKVTKSDKLSISLKPNENSLKEVVIVGYGTQKRMEVTGAVGSVSAISSVISGRVAGVRVNGKDFQPEISIRGYSSLPADVLKNIQVINDYGDQANLTGVKDGEPNKILNINTRKNFAETAFFYPQLHTDKNGDITLDFTMPESLTKWRFKGFAHTKDLKTGYVEQEIVTQKQLSITANTPRFLREGDTIIISARLANLTAAELKGKVNLQLFNALTMQPVSLLVEPNTAQQSFSIAAATTKAVSFRMAIPAGLDALTYQLTAGAGQYTDGEENTLPVLPNRMLVTESMPMMVRPGQEQLFTFDKLVNSTSKTLQNKSLTLEYTQNPVWYAVQALPYMMEFPYECSEQIFSRYYANSLATSLVNKMPAIKKVFDQWKSTNSSQLLSNLEKNQELKSILIEETPWLRDAENETEQKNRVALLFDLNKMSYELQQNLDKLQKKQLPNGGFPWFGGDDADRYITQHVLAGIGQLYYLNIADKKDQTLKSVADKAMNYMDNELADAADKGKRQKDYDKRGLSQIEIHAWYTKSYFTNATVSKATQLLLTDYLKLAAEQWPRHDVYEQAMIALTMQRNKKPEVAQMIIRSLMETAQQSTDMGMYWAKNQSGYYWYQSPVETQSLIIELFTEAGNNDKAVDEMKIWLLRNKQTTNWKTTKATAAACYALLMKGSDWLNDNNTPQIKLGGKSLTELKPDTKADAGTGYIKTSWANDQVKPELGNVDIKNNGKSINWGALHWQYLEQLDKITSSKTDIQLERKYFIQKQGDIGAVLTAVDATHQPKTGDLLKVVVYLKAGRDFEYVHLKDMRPAGTEPADVLSTYKYQDGLYYYQVTKDVATNFFISNLNKGNYVFEYRLRVAQPGNFSTGISTVESMYAPEFSAHSEGGKLSVKAN